MQIFCGTAGVLGKRGRSAARRIVSTLRQNFARRQRRELGGGDVPVTIEVGVRDRVADAVARPAREIGFAEEPAFVDVAVVRGVELDFDDIASSANVSVRSIYNHFPTARHLVAGMYERGTARMRHFIAELPGPKVPFDQRVRRFVRTWGRMQDELAPIRWQALVAEDRHPDLQPELAILRRAHREQIGRMFPEIQSTKAQAAATALTDSLTWRALRRHQALGFDAACAVVEEAIKRLAGDRDTRSAERAKERR